MNITTEQENSTAVAGIETDKPVITVTHLKKSFEDWSKNPTRWEHHNESRDGRILFENFLKLALTHEGQ